jgi:glycosyltransferase involved in cell wall biosynthesis
MQAARSRGVEVHSLTPFSVATLSRQFDLVHAHDARAHAWAAALCGAPLVVSRRVAFQLQRSPLSRWKYGRAARFIAVSQCVRRTLIEGGVPEDRVDVVYDGVELPAEPARAEAIVALATDDPLKGAALIREALSGRFDVVFSSDLARDLPRASVFLYITQAEGLGSAALLAMAHGVPVVASRVGGLPEIVQDGVTGVLTENELAAIARALERALADRDRMGVNARAAVARSFTLDAMVAGTQAVYRKVLEC